MDQLTVAQNLMIVGLDGATWDVIDPLLRKGKLPHLARLIREGASGTLRSLDPMISTMLWTCISSGKLPDQHGVRDFAVSSKAVRCKRLWDIFSQEGFSVGIYGHLITWPPDAVDGFMVPGTFAMGPETHPPELAFLRKLAMEEASGTHRGLGQSLSYAWKGWRHGLRLGTLWRLGKHLLKVSLNRMDPQLDFYQKRLLKLQVDSDIFCYLMRTFHPRFSFFYTHLLDSTQHMFWKYMEPGSFQNVTPEEVARYGWVIHQAYEQADAALGQVLSCVGPETVVMIVSDHGAQASGGESGGSPWTIKTENILKLLGLWGQVSAANIGFHLYLAPKKQGPETKARLMRALGGIVEQKTGQPIFQVVPMEYSYFKVQLLEERLSQLQGTILQVGENHCPFEEVVEVSSGQVSGAHHPHGICILWGPPIQEGVKISSAGLLDVTPTALMLMGLPVAEDMTGRPLLEALTEEFRRSRSLRHCRTYEDERPEGESDDEQGPMPEELAKQLRALGYLG